MFTNKLFFVLIFFFSLKFSVAQNNLYPLNYNLSIDLNKTLNVNKKQFNTSLKPLINSQFKHQINLDSVLYPQDRYIDFISKFKHQKVLKKLFVENLLLVDTDDFHLSIDLLFNLAKGKNFVTDSSLSINTRGINIKGNIGKRLSFRTQFFENQTFFPYYIRNKIYKTHVVPGQGRWRGFKGWGNDFAYATGILSMTPIDDLNIILGHDKNFIGEGYRSLLLSDNSFSYPFIKFMYSKNNFQYSSILSDYQLFVLPQDAKLMAFARKYSSINYLSYVFANRLEIGFFENVLWNSSDSVSNNNLNINFFNPVIYFRTFQYSLNNDKNIIDGLNVKLKITKGIQLYGQFVLDDLKTKNDTNRFDSKNGYQTGIKFFDLFTVKNLYFQVEYNSVRPYTYTHTSVYQSYTNFNEALAHPLGANFNELIFITNYSFKSFNIELKYININQGIDIASQNYGSDLFASYDNITYDNNLNICRGNKVTTTHRYIKISYLINPSSNMRLFFEFDNRFSKSESSSLLTNFYFFGLRTSLTNSYFDF